MKNLLIIAAIVALLGAGMMMRSHRNENLVAGPDGSSEAVSSLAGYKSADSLQYALEGMLPVMTSRADVEALLVGVNGAAAGPAVPRAEGGYLVEYAYGRKVITVFYDDRNMTKSAPLVSGQ